MKCPKCGYLGFDTGDRCRNCGYDFSLVGQPAADPAPGHTPAGASGASPHDPRFARGARYRQLSRRGEGAGGPLTAPPEGAPVDLPLFGVDGPVLPPPRAPLAVRRATPTPARIRPRTPAPQPSDMPLLGGGFEASVQAQPQPSAGVTPDARPEVQAGRPAATAGRRAAAAAIDLGLMATIDLVVLHFTLSLCGLGFNDLRLLPLVPMLGFLLVLNGGYVVLFTGTLGQTFGKMATSIEVVSVRRDSMDLRRAALRGAAIIVALLPAGIGWLAGLVGDRRGLHDYLAGTRVVRAAGA